MTFEVKIATLNLFNYAEPPLAYHEFDSIYTQAQWQLKQQWLSDWVNVVQPQLLGMQEVFSPDALQAQLATHGFSHFAKAGEPSIEGYVANQSVVMLASQFPILESAYVPLDFTLAARFGVNEEFSPSREMLRATVILPDLGTTDIYVVHLKSPRAMLDHQDVNLDGYGAALAGSALGRWASVVKRGTEAMLLYQAIIERRGQSGNAVVVMGDFNATIDSSELRGLLTAPHQLYRGDLHATGLLALTERERLRHLRHFQLQDAQAIAQACAPEHQRRVSHYHGALGFIVDHILLSQEFDCQQQHSLGSVSQYQIFNQHLISPQHPHDDYASDHAPVLVNIKLR
ncbi:endonuclease/exonuclease/phosphatase family protein [Shewanella avicenniae]|uniref:Endonuclease/exonuclease/phosphatase family protein n=1 Tax=Shewanella avicenniae TaxID=2814294 RepID=A0ABX7QQL6_9GAMM|nr:endonuclease/exonuclease/phosphatase family protein [Shewanella avicenniae]QSX32991.1 endonuclease/exonuclease/phosphatase family protein [Shewanella avicenniae]